MELLGVFLAFVSSTGDGPSFRRWWISFRTQFLETAYPTPSGARPRSLSLVGAADEVLPSSPLHPVIFSILTDWTESPLPAKAIFFRPATSAGENGGSKEEEEEKGKEQGQEVDPSKGEVEEEEVVEDDESIQFLFGLCGHQCTSLTLEDESVSVLQPAMRFYRSLVRVSCHLPRADFSVLTRPSLNGATEPTSRAMAAHQPLSGGTQLLVVAAGWSHQNR